MYLLQHSVNITYSCFQRGDITADTTEIQWIIRNVCEQLYVNKLDNLEIKGKFLEAYNLSILNLEDRCEENVNRPITSKES